MSEEKCELGFGVKVPSDVDYEVEYWDIMNKHGIRCTGFYDWKESFLLVEESIKSSDYGRGGYQFIGKEIAVKPGWEASILEAVREMGLKTSSDIGWWLLVWVD